MFSLFPVLGFAQIHPDTVHEGVMPNKRQAVGTGVTTSTSTEPTSTSETSTSETSETPATTSSDTPTSTTAEPTSATTTSPTSNDQTTTSENVSTPSSTEASPTSSADQSSASSDGPSSSEASPSSEAAANTASSTVETSVPVTTTDSAGSTVTSQRATRTVVPASTATSSGPVRTQTGKSSNFVVIGSSTINPKTLSSKTTITSALLAQETRDYTTTTFWTSDGTTGSSVITGRSTFTSTTGYATATVDPSLANGGNGGSGSSLTPHTKAIIGGVVGGVGGAILLGGLAIVAWRLWGKKKREQVPQDDYMESPADSIRREKGTSGAGLPPNTADSYTNPNGAVNTASNF